MLGIAISSIAAALYSSFRVKYLEMKTAIKGIQNNFTTTTGRIVGKLRNLMVFQFNASPKENNISGTTAADNFCKTPVMATGIKI